MSSSWWRGRRCGCVDVLGGSSCRLHVILRVQLWLIATVVAWPWAATFELWMTTHAAEVIQETYASLRLNRGPSIIIISMSLGMEFLEDSGTRISCWPIILSYHT